MTELRRQMEDDMVVRGMADRTRETYLWAVTGQTWQPEAFRPPAFSLYADLMWLLLP